MKNIVWLNWLGFDIKTIITVLVLIGLGFLISILMFLFYEFKNKN